MVFWRGGLLLGFNIMMVLGVSVLVHELGHAFAARALGAEPVIRLHALGGLTSFVPPVEPTRRQSIGVSVAGPAAGFVLGFLVLIARQVVEDPVVGSVSYHTWRFLILINILWGLLNLIPMLPLDGGHVMENLLPGEALQRRRRAAIVSIVVGLSLAYFLYQRGEDFFALFVLYFAFQSMAVLASVSKKNQQKDAERDELEKALDGLNAGHPGAVTELERLGETSIDPTVQRYAKMLVVQRAATDGDVVRARQQLDAMPGDVHPSIYGLVAMYEGDPTGLQQISDAVINEPTPAAAHILALGHIRAGYEKLLVESLGSGPPGYREPSFLSSVQHTLHTRAKYDEATQVGELLIAMRPESEPQAYYNVASSWAGLGNTERALTRLDEAIERGWNDLRRLDSDPNFARYRHDVDYGAVRGKLRTS